MKHTDHGQERLEARQGPADDDMYQNEHNELFASIRAGKPINNGDYMCKSTLMAIMGRMATYTGQDITWEHGPELQGGPDAGRVRVRRPADAAGGRCRA